VGGIRSESRNYRLWIRDNTNLIEMPRRVAI